MPVLVNDPLRLAGSVRVRVERSGVIVHDETVHNLLTTAGKDFVTAQVYNTSPGVAGANYIACSTNATTPVVGDTTLAGEITTNGLSRAQAAVAHVTGASTVVLQKTFTAQASFSQVQKLGLFTASSGGTLVHETLVTGVDLIANDNLMVTWTITLS